MSIRLGVVLAICVSLTGCKRDDQPPPDGPVDSGTSVPDAGSGASDAGSGAPDAGGGAPDAGAQTGCFQMPPRSQDWSGEGFMFGDPGKSAELLDVAVNSRGILYLAGYRGGTVGQARVDPSGDSKAVLMRVGSEPSVSVLQYWVREFDNPGASDTLDVLAFHPDTGALYFAGRTTGAFPGFRNLGQQDVFIGGPRGTERDQILYQGGSARPQHPNRLAFTAPRANNGQQRDIVVSGYDDVYVTQNYVERWEDPFLLQVEPLADGLLGKQWWTEFNTTYTDTLGGLAVDTTTEARTIYVTGSSLSGAQRGPFVRKIASDGTLGAVWTQSRTGMDMIQAIHIRPDGKLLIAGSTFSQLGEKSYGDQDVVVQVWDPTILFGPNPKPEWTAQFGSEQSEWVTDMAVDARGNIFVVGETLGAVDEAVGNQGDYDIFLLKFSPQGELLLRRQWGSPGDDHPSAVTTDACGEAFIVGYTMGDLLGDAFPLTGQRDAFILTTARTEPPATHTP